MGEPREHPGLRAPGRAGGGVPKAGAEAPRAWLVASGPGARHRRASQLGGGGAGCPPAPRAGPRGRRTAGRQAQPLPSPGRRPGTPLLRPVHPTRPCPGTAAGRMGDRGRRGRRRRHRRDPQLLKTPPLRTYPGRGVRLSNHPVAGLKGRAWPGSGGRLWRGARGSRSRPPAAEGRPAPGPGACAAHAGTGCASVSPLPHPALALHVWRS